MRLGRRSLLVPQLIVHPCGERVGVEAHTSFRRPAGVGPLAQETFESAVAGIGHFLIRAGPHLRALPSLTLRVFHGGRFAQSSSRTIGRRILALSRSQHLAEVERSGVFSRSVEARGDLIRCQTPSAKLFLDVLA